MDLISTIIKNAQRNIKRIVLPEGTEERTIKAADSVIGKKIANITLLGNPERILSLAKSYGLKNIEQATIIDPSDHPKKKEYIDLMVELRKAKGLTRKRPRQPESR